eukprot:gene17573-23898_t
MQQQLLQEQLQMQYQPQPPAGAHPWSVAQAPYTQPHFSGPTPPVDTYHLQHLFQGHGGPLLPPILPTARPPRPPQVPTPPGPSMTPHDPTPRVPTPQGPPKIAAEGGIASAVSESGLRKDSFELEQIGIRCFVEFCTGLFGLCGDLCHTGTTILNSQSCTSDVSNKVVAVDQLPLRCVQQGRDSRPTATEVVQELSNIEDRLRKQMSPIPGTAPDTL